eukprot:3052397-Ditylum_brightwellii.AAC.1
MLLPGVSVPPAAVRVYLGRRLVGNCQLCGSLGNGLEFGLRFFLKWAVCCQVGCWGFRTEFGAWVICKWHGIVVLDMFVREIHVAESLAKWCWKAWFSLVNARLCILCSTLVWRSGIA